MCRHRTGVLRLTGDIEYDKLGVNAVVVTVLSDSNKKYLSADLLKTEPIKQNYISQDVEFIDYKAIDRL